MEGHVEVHGQRASSVIVHRVPAASRASFLSWQQGISEAAAHFPGYQATDVYAPPDDDRGEWVAVVHFNRDEELRQWLASAERRKWTEALPEPVRDFKLKTLPAGFGGWFAGLVDGPAAGAPPAGWKMALSVLLGLYPTVMLLTLFVGPKLTPLGLALSMLVSNALSICLLQWAIMPVLNRLLGTWLAADDQSKVRLWGGLAGVLCALGAMTWAFTFL